MTDTHAVVLGGSLAGLCAASALADACAHVTVVDRDALPEDAVERAGVPQARHVHALLVRGRRELEHLFPGFEATLLARGALDMDFGLEWAALRQYGWQRRESAGLTGLFASRVLVESVVRELLRTRGNVTLVERTEATGLAAADGRLTGVLLRARDGGDTRRLAADLVVDASGRGSHAPAWLAALGLPVPEETVVDSLCGYSTRWYQAPPPERWPREWWWKGIWIDPPHEALFGGLLSPVENGRWVVTLAGVAGNYPPADEAGFDATLTRLRSPILAQAVRLAEPISPVYCNRAMANRFRHYERWPARLAGFLAVGDAACAFNPVYGQGMTTAAVSARILADCLAAGGPTAPDLPARFFRAQARFHAEAWDLATGADFRFDATIGTRPRLLPLVNHYMDALFAASNDDAVVRAEIIEVIHMLKPPTALFGMGIAARTALHALGRLAQGFGAAPAPVPALPAA